MDSLGKFASSAYQALKHIEDLKIQVSEREKAEAEVRELARRLESKIRRLVDANVVGIVMWNLEGAITGANDAFLRRVQYNGVDLASGRIRWRDLTPAEWADDLPVVVGDRVQRQQVTLNLVLNASEAMSSIDDRPRQLMISTVRDDGDRVRVIVQDAGVGFDPESAARLFEAFYTTKSSGMGIGLSVSRSILESHHWRISGVRNDGPGATFSFSIPRAPERLPEWAHVTRDS